MSDEKPLMWGEKRYHTWNYHLRQRFGEKVSKIPLDAGFTCPNRDGTVSTGGCIFCSSKGSGDYAGNRAIDLVSQFHQMQEVMHKKWPRAKYIGYFQAFTNTYAPVAELRQRYETILAQEDVVGLSIATRPDCLPDDVLDLLAEVNWKTYLWVELGWQTMHEETGRLINRGYDNACFYKAVEQLRAKGIRTCVHMIVGLPGESAADIMATATAIAALPVQGIKIHLLHLMKGTAMVELYEAGRLRLLDQETYTRLVVDILEVLPPEMVIHRITGDSPRSLLIGPKWSLKKWEVLNGIDDELARRDTWQGKYFVK